MSREAEENLLVVAEELGLTYPDGTVALRSVRLEVRAGEVLGVLGANGSGKTTLLKALAGVVNPTSGRLRHRSSGVPVSPRLARRRTVVLFDSTPLLDVLSGTENLARLLELRGWWPAEAKQRAARWLERFALTERQGAPVHTYSLGMRRKLLLAEAFAAEAPLLLLDEPLIGLDARARATLATALTESAAAGRTSILAGHDADFFRRVCDRVVFVHRGRMVAEGPPAMLLARLDGQTVFEVALPPEGSFRRFGSWTLPPGLQWVARAADEWRVASTRGPEDLSRLADWLVASGLEVHGIRVRPPGLEDAYLASTGAPLRDEVRSHVPEW